MANWVCAGDGWHAGSGPGALGDMHLAEACAERLPIPAPFLAELRVVSGGVGISPASVRGVNATH